MNMHKVILLSVGLFMATKANQAATPLPDLAGLRCEFNGEIEFSLNPNNIETDQALGYIFELVRGTNHGQLYDAADPRSVLVSENGKFVYRLMSNQWIWIMKNTPIQLTLKPNPDMHTFPQEHVYFFNVFSKPLTLQISSGEYRALKDMLYVRIPKNPDALNKPTWQCDHEGEVYSTTISPGESIIYPANSGISITLKN